MAVEGNAADQGRPPAADGDPSVRSARPADGSSRRGRWRAQLGHVIRAMRDSDHTVVEDAVLRLSRSRRLFAPIALVVGALVMLFDGLRLLLTNWRLSLVQLLPAMWIWAAMVDLKAHLLHGKSFHVLTGPVVVPLVLAVAAVTAAGFFLNAVFAFAIAGPAPPAIRPAFGEARSHLTIVLGWGIAVGVALGLSTVVFPRWGSLWFGLALSIVIGVMMLCYVAVPARLIGLKAAHSKRDKLTATAVGGAIGAVVSTPPYLLGRLGLIMLGSHALFIPGIVVLAIGLTLEAGATTAVKTVKMSAKLASGGSQPGADQASPGGASQPTG